MIFRVEEEKYWVSTLYCPRTLRAMEEYKGDLDVQFRKIAKEIDMYAVQGPKALEIVKSIAKEDITGLKRFQIIDNRVGDHVTLDWDVDAVAAKERRFLDK